MDLTRKAKRVLVSVRTEGGNLELAQLVVQGRNLRRTRIDIDIRDTETGQVRARTRTGERDERTYRRPCIGAGRSGVAGCWDVRERKGDESWQGVGKDRYCLVRYMSMGLVEVERQVLKLDEGSQWDEPKSETYRAIVTIPFT